MGFKRSNWAKQRVDAQDQNVPFVDSMDGIPANLLTQMYAGYDPTAAPADINAARQQALNTSAGVYVPPTGETAFTAEANAMANAPPTGALKARVNETLTKSAAQPVAQPIPRPVVQPAAPVAQPVAPVKPQPAPALMPTAGGPAMSAPAPVTTAPPYAVPEREAGGYAIPSQTYSGHTDSREAKFGAEKGRREGIGGGIAQSTYQNPATLLPARPDLRGGKQYAQFDSSVDTSRVPQRTNLAAARAQALRG